MAPGHFKHRKASAKTNSPIPRQILQKCKLQGGWTSSPHPLAKEQLIEEYGELTADRRSHLSAAQLADNRHGSDPIAINRQGLIWDLHPIHRSDSHRRLAPCHRSASMDYDCSVDCRHRNALLLVGASSDGLGCVEDFPIYEDILVRRCSRESNSRDFATQGRAIRFGEAVAATTE